MLEFHKPSKAVVTLSDRHVFQTWAVIVRKECGANREMVSVSWTRVRFIRLGLASWSIGILTERFPKARNGKVFFNWNLINTVLPVVSVHIYMCSDFNMSIFCEKL